MKKQLFIFQMVLSLCIASAACNQAPRGQWIWDIGQKNEFRPNPKLLENLQTRADFDFRGQRLDRVFEQLHEATGANFQINWAALEAAGIDRSLVVSLRLEEMTLTASLDALLNEIGGGETELSYVPQGDILEISTHEDLARRLMVRIYYVGDLIGRGAPATILDESIGPPAGRGSGFDERRPTTQPVRRELEYRDDDALIEIIVHIVDPES